MDGGKPGRQIVGPPPNRITIGELALSALHVEAKDMDRKKSDRIARILIALGWTRGPKVKGQQRWLRPQPPGDGGGRQG